MNPHKLTHGRLKELLRYDPTTGVFTWRVNKGARGVAGCVVGCKHPQGYLVVRLDGNLFRLHRLAFLYMTKVLPSRQVDHQNHIRSDNRWTNLALVSNRVNHMNMKLSANNSSGCTGVHWNKQNANWNARIQVRGKHTHLGCFKRFTSAVAARKAAEKKYSFHSNHGQ
ncbi:MAG: HNH endonuclease [Gammaproteobacteria bacterium]|nr:MAG: HNH endonuclease [Gammaproteobacteria bacterium]